MCLEDFIFKFGCDVYWKCVLEQFEGYFKLKVCFYYFMWFEIQVYLEEMLILCLDVLFLNDCGIDGNGVLVFGVDDKGLMVNLK